ncbi:MAG: hypothetical protein IJW77_03975 [Clostridia bacterium]|nr:hypothetical protein [Clostridia bacterium]
MAKHEFALMDHVPRQGVRYDQYEGEHLVCAAVDDDAIECRLRDFEILPTYAHTVDHPWGGLCYCGITLIPPHAAREMYWMVCTDPAFDELTAMLKDADREHKWIIHFGI